MSNGACARGWFSASHAPRGLPVCVSLSPSHFPFARARTHAGALIKASVLFSLIKVAEGGIYI